MMGQSVTETIEEVCEDICSNYCKYPVMCDDPELWEEKTASGDNEICNNCPLNILH